ncbi:hypothetical protein ACFFJX_08370 [Pseudarcicella hirudinis]|uniref:hypothetical protein n=1 Tax=Pseudarcicella hirudinis TaxID=1079859 RepID=UPI0035EA4C4D
MVKSGEVGITLMSLVGEADGLIVADNMINSGTGMTTGSTGIKVEGQYRVYGTLLNNDINNVEVEVDTGTLGSIRYAGFSHNYYKFRGSNGIELSNGVRLSEYFGKPTPAQPYGSQGYVYNQASGSVRDIGGWEYRADLSTGWKKVVSLDSEMLDSSTMPTTGNFNAGVTVWNDNPMLYTTYGVNYSILGWKRLTSGSSHALGVDWYAIRSIDPTGVIAVQTLSDLNGLGKEGWFKTTAGPANAPAGSSPTAFFQGVQFLSNGQSDYINQLVFDTSGNEYKRTKSGGVWGSWYKVSSRLEGSTAQRNAIVSPQEGQDYYNTETHAKEFGTEPFGKRSLLIKNHAKPHISYKTDHLPKE